MEVWLGGGGLATQLLLLLLAFVLSGVIGFERERRFKSAGLGTHILVGVGAALFTLVSAYGFTSLGLHPIDPTRIAAQVVTGIGFVGAGVIFVNRGNVVGLTTAASIWVTAAVGMACAAGLPILAVAGTALHLVTVGSMPIAGRLIRRTTGATVVVLAAHDGDAIQAVIDLCAANGAKTRIDEMSQAENGAAMEFSIHVKGRRSDVEALISAIAQLDGVKRVSADTTGLS
ncbi:MgtC/SapB family protein [Leifsonia poae]|uniref:Magnesium transport MgtC family protein n=1 Tax=Leifsonia poae TaxID=110933 RepID=A0A9W6HBJ8_9MICO|nr:MgtC/SapB family protein [Leifsonia poae]GLJ77126.1 putative magnesium transport MgtC family protein [Leifsonia poae]